MAGFGGSLLTLKFGCATAYHNKMKTGIHVLRYSYLSPISVKSHRARCNSLSLVSLYIRAGTGLAGSLVWWSQDCVEPNCICMNRLDINALASNWLVAWVKSLPFKCKHSKFSSWRNLQHQNIIAANEHLYLFKSKTSKSFFNFALQHGKLNAVLPNYQLVRWHHNQPLWLDVLAP